MPPTGVWLQLLLTLAQGTFALPSDPGLQLRRGQDAQRPLHVADSSTTAVAQKHKLNGRFLHITDFHPDLFYKARTSTEESFACHHGKGFAGTYGAELTDCDTPFSLINATFDWIAANLKDDIDFVVWTGDSARHDSDEEQPRTTAEVIETNRIIADKFVDTFSSGKHGLDIPVVPTFGNNDFLPHNIFYPGPNKWLHTYSDIWKRFIPEQQRHSFEFGGWFYVEVVPNRLAILSLNTMYFFDRNAGVDGCANPNEPGYKHMEWLRVQLQRMRETGMKAILIGHVPPAKTESKELWDSTCWQKYTLWLHQFRDVVTGSLYGHMNIDHFLLSDSKDVDITAMTASATGNRHHLDDEGDEDFSTESKADYLEDLMENWSNLPRSAAKGLHELEVSDTEAEGDKAGVSKKGKKKKPKKKKDKKKDQLKKIGGKHVERYQLTLISPSLVPNYFPTLRVIEYNITGLEQAPAWVDPFQTQSHSSHSRPELEEDEPHLELKRDLDAKKKKKGKKGKKPKKPKKPKDPNLIIPDDPAKDALPGPAYFPQSLTLTGYTQYFANLTYINNDVHESDIGGKGWREGKHGGKQPKHEKPKPRDFAYEVEYSTFNDSVYKLPDLTVKSFFKLAYKIGKHYNAKGANIWDDNDFGDEVDEEEDDDDNEDDGIFEDAAQSDDNDNLIDTDIPEESQEGDADEFSTGKKKKKDKKGKKHRKKKKSKKNKEWLHFLSRAFVGAVSMEELEGN